MYHVYSKNRLPLYISYKRVWEVFFLFFFITFNACIESLSFITRDEKRDEDNVKESFPSVIHIALFLHSAHLASQIIGIVFDIPSYRLAISVAR